MLAGWMLAKCPFKAISNVNKYFLFNIILGCRLHRANKSHTFAAINMLLELTFQDEKIIHDALDAWR